MSKLGALVVVVGVMGLAASALAEVQTRTVEYEHDGVKLQGYLALPDGAAPAGDDDRQGVLVVHEWWGLNDYVKSRARQLAELGYVAFAPDMYGSGKVTTDPKEAGAWAGELYSDRQKMRARARAGFDVLHKQPGVDGLAAIGYCFGGAVALELAYTDPDDLEGVAVFHGGPKPPLPGDELEADVLILHGTDDPLTKLDDVKKVVEAIETKEEQDDDEVTLVTYPGAQHAFTNPDADKAGINGVAYNAAADRASWEALKAFLAEVLNDD